MKISSPVAVSLISLLAACGSDDDSPIGINNVSPGGSVGGVIIDAATMKPMAGVSVTVIAGAQQFPEAPAQTDQNGRFAIDKLPSGDLLVQINPPATHLGVTMETYLDNAAGEFPLGNATVSLGPIVLLPLTTNDNAFRVQLVTPEGTAAPNVKADLRADLACVNLSTGKPVAYGSSFVEATSDNAGVVHFAGMPDLVKLTGMNQAFTTVTVVIPPYDSNKDNIFEFFGSSKSFTLALVGSAVPTMVLSSGSTPTLQVLATNIAAMMGKTGNRVLSSTGGPLFMAFNYPIVDALTEISVYDERGQAVTSAAKKAVTANLLSVNFEGLVEGAEYNVSVRTFASVEGSMVEGTFGAPVFTPVKQGGVQVVSLTRTTADPNRVHVTFSEPIGIAPAVNTMNGVLFFNADLNNSGSIGDAAGERGYMSSSLYMSIDEVTPPGTAGHSGLSSYWTFDLPSDSVGPVAPTTLFDLAFSRVGAGNTNVERADGTLVADIGNQSVPAVP